MKSALESLTAIKIGELILRDFKNQIKDIPLKYSDFEDLQNSYEKILYELCNLAYEKGKNDLSKKDFNAWLSLVCAYDGK